MEAEDYAERCGAAIGLAAVVKGLGIGCLKQKGVVAALEAAAASGNIICIIGNREIIRLAIRHRIRPFYWVQLFCLLGLMSSSLPPFSGSAPAKQGSLYALECLCARLKLLFEPYVVVVLPVLLKAFSDGSSHVRDAAQSCAKTIMANLSQHGVKLVGIIHYIRGRGGEGGAPTFVFLIRLSSTSFLTPRSISSLLAYMLNKSGAA